MTTARYRARRLVPLAAGLGATALLITGCAGGSETAAPTDFSYLSFAENTRIQDTLTSLGDDACAAEDDEAPARHHHPAAGQLRPATPAARRPGRTPGALRQRQLAPGREGPQLGRQARRRRRSSSRSSAPATTSSPPRARRSRRSTTARSTCCRPSSTSRASGTTSRSSPTTASRSRRRGTTSWPQRATLNAAGVIPFSADGQDGWPLTRLVGNYLFRVDRSGRAPEGRGRRGRADRPRVRRGRHRGRRARQGRILRPVGRIDRLHDRGQPVPHGRGRRCSTWAAGSSELQRPRAEPDRRREHRLHAVPRRRGRRRQPRPARSERRRAARAVEGRLQRRRRSLARLHRRELRVSVSRGPGRHHRLRRRTPRSRTCRRSRRPCRRRSTTPRTACCGSRRCSTPRRPRPARRTRPSSSPARSRPEEFMEKVQADLN